MCHLWSAGFVIALLSQCLGAGFSNATRVFHRKHTARVSYLLHGPDTQHMFSCISACFMRKIEQKPFLLEILIKSVFQDL
jgi:hypothetical protein